MAARSVRRSRTMNSCRCWPAVCPGLVSRLPGQVRGWPAAAVGRRYQLHFPALRTAPGPVIVRH